MICFCFVCLFVEGFIFLCIPLLWRKGNNWLLYPGLGNVTCFRRTFREIKEIRDTMALIIFTTPFFVSACWRGGSSEGYVTYLDHSTRICDWRRLFVSVRRLDANHITSVPEDSFEGLTQLRHLWLDDNSLTEVPVQPLSNLPTLQALTLALNKISSIPDFAFTNLSSLVVLWVSTPLLPYICVN